MSNGDERRKLITDAWAVAWDHGDVDALDAVLSPDYRRRAEATDVG